MNIGEPKSEITKIQATNSALLVDDLDFWIDALVPVGGEYSLICQDAKTGVRYEIKKVKSNDS